MIVYERIRRTRSGWERIRQCSEAPRYWIGERGTVWRPYRGRLRILKQQSNDAGYRRVSMYRPDGKRISRYVHRLVLLAFVGPCPEGQEGCHSDGNQKNNRVPNLRWDTPKMNAADRIRARYQAREKLRHPEWHSASASPVPF